jgi:1-acyl-sn-glycerol-3-phosphate acyltransferase
MEIFFQVNFYSVLAVLALIIVTPPLIFMAIGWSFFQHTGNGPHLIARLWARLILMATLVKVDVTGRENLDANGTYVFAANHSSMYDILVLLACLPVQFRWLAKEELFRIPFFGRAMRKCGYIPVNRSDPREGIRSLRQAAKQIKAGASVVIFPEGTRSVDGLIGGFKKGGISLALRAGQPLVPVSISGAHRALPTHSLRVRPGPIKVVIDAPIPTAGLDRSAQTALTDQVRERIIANHDPSMN